jgi:hypothetical protein
MGWEHGEIGPILSKWKRRRLGEHDLRRSNSSKFEAGLGKTAG